MKRFLMMSLMTVVCLKMAAQVPEFVECDFVQTQHMSMLKKDMVSYGKMRFHAPDSLRWEYLSPVKLAFILEGQKITVTNDGRTIVSNSDQKKVFGEISRMMMGVASRDTFVDDGAFSTTVQKEGNIRLVTLLPLKKPMQQFMERMVVYSDTVSGSVTRVEMYAKTGDSTIIEFKNIKKTL